jgi:hypothetical protein
MAHGEGVYTTEIGKHYKSRCFVPESWLLNSFQHTTDSDSPMGRSEAAVRTCVLIIVKLGQESCNRTTF